MIRILLDRFVNLNKEITNMDNNKSDQGGLEIASGGWPKTSGNTAARSKKAILAGIFFLFLLVVAGAAVFLARDFFSMSPETVLKKMTQAMAGAQTMEFNGDIDGTVKFHYGKDLAAADSKARETTDLNIEFYGAADFTDPVNQRTSLNLEIENDDLLEGSLYFDSVAVGDAIYAKLSGTSSLRNDDIFAPFWGQWARIDPTKISGQITQNYPELAKKTGSPIIKAAIGPEQVKELRDALAYAGLFTFKEDLGDTEANGVDCRHYEVEITKDALRGYVRELGAIAQDQISQQYVGRLIDMIGQTKISNVEVWISKQDFTLQRISAAADYRDDLNGMISYSANLSGDIDWSTINGAVKIEVPGEVKDYDAIFKESDTYVQAEMRDEKRRADMRAYVLAQTKYYQVYNRYFSFEAVDGGCDSPSGPCYPTTCRSCPWIL
jgi:hypothetical protein